MFCRPLWKGEGLTCYFFLLDSNQTLLVYVYFTAFNCLVLENTASMLYSVISGTFLLQKALCRKDLRKQSFHRLIVVPSQNMNFNQQTIK